MHSIFGGLVRLIKYVIILTQNILEGALEWITPRCFIAKDVSKDIVLITGAGSGLGRQIALEFARLGSSLVLWDINKNGLIETKDLIDEEFSKLTNYDSSRFCSIYIVDVSKKEVVEKFADRVYQDLNKARKADESEKYVTVLVNNAGIYYGSLLLDLTEEQIERIFNINVLSHFWTVRAFLPKMIEHERGHIVEVASQGGLVGMLKQVDYCATKFATVGFEESLSIELDYLGLSNKVHTTVICPYFFSSNLFTGIDASKFALMTSEYVASEAVMTMRCNHRKIILPLFEGYLSQILKTFCTRKALISLIWANGMKKGLRDVKGQAN